MVVFALGIFVTQTELGMDLATDLQIACDECWGITSELIDNALLACDDCWGKSVPVGEVA